MSVLSFVFEISDIIHDNYRLLRATRCKFHMEFQRAFRKKNTLQTKNMVLLGS